MKKNVFTYFLSTNMNKDNDDFYRGNSPKMISMREKKNIFQFFTLLFELCFISFYE